MADLLGVQNIWVFVGMTLLLMGGAAILLGQALAVTWRPLWQVIFYAILLAIATRFLILSLFETDPFFSPGRWAYGTIVDAVCHIAYAYAAYRVTQVSKLVSQYPWLYVRTSPFSYAKKPG